jgi:hypothetical protein
MHKIEQGYAMAQASPVPAVKSAREFLTDPAFELLDRAAIEYNRIAGCLETGRATGSATLIKVAPSVLQAADEAMADVLHQASVLDRYPESHEAATLAAEDEIRLLRETADRVEDLSIAPPDGARTTAASRLEGVLEDLRFEQLARSELREPAEELDQQTRA